MSAVLLEVLERAELNKLPRGAQTKLERHLTELRTQHERLRADCDQQNFDVEKRLTESQEQFLSTARDLQTVKEENSRLNEELVTLKGIEGASTDGKPPEQTKTKHEIEAERRELARQLEKRTQELEHLTEDVRLLKERLAESNRVKMEVQLKLDEIQSSEASIQGRERRVVQEKQLLQQQTERLSAELKTKSEELLSSARERGQETLELRCALDNTTEQVSGLQGQLAALREVSEGHHRRAEDLNNKLKQCKEQQCAMEEKYRNELNAHIKLSSLYKGAASESEDKNQELGRAVEELSKLVKDSGEANNALQKKLSEGEELRTRLQAELKEKMKKMEKEVENASMKAASKQCCVPSLTEEQLDSMCPSAAAIAEIVKPGMKFFELYNAFSSAQSQLQLEKQESRRVSRVLDEIVQEVESKAPVLRRQREEYEALQRSMASLCNKLELARDEIHGLQKEKEEVKQHCSDLEKEKLRTERLLEDTSTQLCSLLVEKEQQRGVRVTTEEDATSSDISSSSEVVSPRHISFSSVKELQTQNQTLLGQLRGLEEERDRHTVQITSSRVSELEVRVEQLQKEVEQLREQRNQQKQLADSGCRQRDMYRILLTQNTGYSLPPHGTEASPQPTPPRTPIPATRSTPQRPAATESAQIAHAKAALKQLNDAYSVYKKEKAENDRLLSETTERLQQEVMELRASKAKMAAHTEFSNKRYDMLQDTVAAYRREISALQARSTRTAALNQQQESIIHTLTHDLRLTNERLALEEVRVENMSKEKDMLRQAESRLCQEKEVMLSEQRSQNLLLNNLKSIQLTMERNEADTCQRLSSKVEHLEAELVAMRTKMDQEVEQRHAQGRNMDAQLLEAKKQLESQNVLQQKTKELLEHQVDVLRTQLASSSSSSSLEAGTMATAASGPATRGAGLRAPPKGAASPAQQEVSELKERVRGAEEQSGELKEQLRSATASVEQYKAVVLCLEDSLKKEKQARVPLELRLKELQEVQQQLEKRIQDEQKEKEQSLEEGRSALVAMEKRVGELQRSLKSSQSEQQEALERCAAAVSQEQRATQDSITQTRLAAEAQSKYERELMLHAADVEALQELKKQSQKEAASKRRLEEQLSNTSSSLREKTAGWTALERKMKEDLASQAQRCGDLGRQNSLLHQQMDQMASSAKQLLPPQALDTSLSEEGKTTQQILEILRFVRREKEISLAQCEVSEGEAQRCRQRLEAQEVERKDLQDALNTERDRMQDLLKNVSQQEERLKKMEDIKEVQEANRLLKADRDRLEQELQQVTAKVGKLQRDIAPLQLSLSQQAERIGSLQAEKRLLEEDLKRWRTRAQQLMSQQKDSDVEEKQKLANEREAQQKRITHMAEESAKLKTELARANASSNSAQAQLLGLKDNVARLSSERDSLKKDTESKNNDILEKNKTITQVKKIGRRYKTQYEELKVQHDKLVEEAAAKPGRDAGSGQEVSQELNQAREELNKTREELNSHKEEAQKKQEELQKLQQEVEEARKENQKSKEQLQEVQTQVSQNQGQLTQVQSQLSQAQSQLAQNQNQASQSQKDLHQAKTHSQQLLTQLKSAQAQAQARQRELQQTLANQKDLQQTQVTTQQSHNQELNTLKSIVSDLQSRLDGLQKRVSEQEAEKQQLQDQLAAANQATDGSTASQSSPASDSTAASDANKALQEELAKLRQELSESSSREEQLRQQMTEKEEKIKKSFHGAKTKIQQLITAKQQLSQQVEELRQSREELRQSREEQEVRMGALKSQYEGRLLRLDRERRGPPGPDSREEAPDQSSSKVSDHARSGDQRHLKSPAQDRGSSSTSDPPTANIRPTPSTTSPSNKPNPASGNKSTPRASIRPMVTPATVSMPTPTATVMPTTQTDSQEVVISTSGSVHSTSSGLGNTPTSLSQPSSSQATAFVQPTQQQASNQEVASSMDQERPSTSSPVIGGAGPKRVREEEEEEPETSHSPPSSKKLRLRQTVTLLEEGDGGMEGEDEMDRPDSVDDSQEIPEVGFPVLGTEGEESEDVGVSQSVPSDQVIPQAAPQGRDVIVIDTDSESRESKESEEEEEEEEEEEKEEEEEDDEYKEEEDEDTGDGGMGGEGSNDGSGGAEEEEEGAMSSEGSEPVKEEENLGAASSDCSSRPSSHSGEGSSSAVEPLPPREMLYPQPSSTTSSPAPPTSSLTPRLPQPRRPPHPLPPRLYIQPPAPELGPPHAQRQSSQLRRPSVGRGPQLTPGIGSMQHFFDDDDRMVPSTPTLVVPHRTDGFAEAIHSPQVAALSTRFRFGPPEDLLPQSSGHSDLGQLASHGGNTTQHYTTQHYATQHTTHSDLGQLASHGGLGMYESPLFLAAHEEEGGGRSVPTTPLQIAAPVTVFSESLPLDSSDNMASQSVPMVTNSGGMGAGDDEVFMEQEGEGLQGSSESHPDPEASGQQSEDAALPSTSQDPDSSSAPRRPLVGHAQSSSLASRGPAFRGRGDGRTTLIRRGVTFSRAGRGGVPQ
ncbi:nucleoprotein TPR isoform X4 [Gadus morhua]|uniref:nucleoprotein TPR isoform X4 n=1 Tax=Gadus morhua TaxID=8049 RepID=UPI0011B5006A|nr:nucleoprotein TPR-like isoform X4 [Gadus morhua]